MLSITRRPRAAVGLVVVLLLTAICVPASGSVDPGFLPIASKALSAENLPNHIVLPDGRYVIWAASITVDGTSGQILRLNQNGTVDGSFSYCGCLLTSVTRILRQADGKLLVSGSGPDFQARIVRLNENGSHDQTFSSVLGGFSHIQSVAELWAVQPDGRILATVSGSLGSGFHSGYLVRLNADGSVDPGFSQLGYDGGRLITTYVRALELDPAGRFYLATVTFSGGGSSVSVRRYLSGGTADTSWEAPVISGQSFPNLLNVSSLALQSDGSLIISGSFTTVNGVPKADFARVLPAGNVDLGFSTSGIGSGGGTVRVLASGKLMVVSGARLYRLNGDGSTDAGFSLPAAVSSVATAFSVDGVGRIVFAGQSSTGDYRMFRLEQDGAADPSFNPNATRLGEVHSAVRMGDGRIIVAGNFIQINGAPKRSVARINPDGTLDGSFDGGTGFSSPPTSLALQADDRIIAVGSFSSYNGQPAAGFARINADGSLDQAFAPAVQGVYGAVPQPDGKILIFGGFETVNGISRPRIARLNPDGSLDGGFAVSIAGGVVYSVVVQADGKLIVGGSFSGVDGFNRSNLVRLNANGSLDQSLNASGISSVRTVIVQPDGRYLCVLIGASVPIVRRNPDGSADDGFAAPSFSSSDLRINAADLRPDGSVIVGGNFSGVGLAVRRNLVRLGPNGTLDRLFLPAGADLEVRALVPQPDGKLVVAGDFSKLGGENRGAIGRIVPGSFTRVVNFDFDGDGRADPAVFRPSENKWYILRSSDFGVTQTVFAIPGDRPVPADFDGDGITDIAIFRPSAGDWWSLSTISNAQMFAHLGAAGDIPLPSDINGDGRADYVVYRPGNFNWYRVASSNGAATNIQFGAAGDKPVIGDVDGDGIADPVIYRPSTGDWWWRSSVDAVQRAVKWGIASDVPAPADFDGDGKTDFAVYRPADGLWYIRNSADSTYTIVKFGIAEDKPVPADYDGDGRSDIAVYRPSTGVWYLLRSTAGFAAYQFGLQTDIPAAGAFVP